MIYPSQYFDLRLKEEKIRSDQTGKPFSILLVSMDKVNRNEKDRAYLSEVLEKFLNNTRLSDSLGWFSDGDLGLILQDTDETGAQNVIARLRDYLLRHRIPKSNWEKCEFAVRRSFHRPRDTRTSKQRSLSLVYDFERGLF
jgi:GGDEF domain-containing protein